MSRLDVNSIRHTDGSADNITLDGSKNVTCENNLQVDGNVTVTGTIPADKLTGTLPAISGANLTGISSAGKAHNLMVNGSFIVAQRGISSTDSGYKTVDRFAYYKAGTQTQSQAAIASATSGPYASGFRKCYKVANGSNTAGNTDAATFQYTIEDQDLACSGWNHTDPNSKLTLSFWARSSVAQTFYFQIRTKHGTNQGYWSSYALSANTWTKVTKTIPGYANIELANDTGQGFNLSWNLYYGTDSTGSGGLAENTWGAFAGGTSTPDQTNTWQNTNAATFELTGVQLETGDSATDFAHKSYGDELLRCQRYYQVDRSSNVNSMYEAASTYNGKWYQKDHTVEMRAKPTVSTANGTNGISNSGWTGSTPTPYSSNTHTVYYSSGNAFHLAGTSDGNIGATYDSEL